MENTKNVKPLNMVAKIKELYGKNTIVVSGNLIYRCSTGRLEKGPKSLNDLYLPNYGKMQKLLIADDGVYELNTEIIQKGTEFAQYTKGNKVDLDLSEILFDEDIAWNKPSKKTKAIESVEEAA